MTTWDRILILITRNSVSKKGLAKICNVGPSAVTKWATGGDIGADKIAHIAIHFGVTTDWILGVSEGSNITPLLHLTSSHSPIKKVKISELERSATELRTALEGMQAGLKGLEKAIEGLKEN
jgi:hypothetical protein